jgi:hypothetical protein
MTHHFFPFFVLLTFPTISLFPSGLSGLCKVSPSKKLRSASGANCFSSDASCSNISNAAASDEGDGAEENLEAKRASRPDSSRSTIRDEVESGAGGFQRRWFVGEMVRGMRGRGEVEKMIWWGPDGTTCGGGGGSKLAGVPQSARPVVHRLVALLQY